MVRAKSKKRARKPYTTDDIKLLRQHSKARTPVKKIAKLMKRSEGLCGRRHKRSKSGSAIGGSNLPSSDSGFFEETVISVSPNSSGVDAATWAISDARRWIKSFAVSKRDWSAL